ncbi:MAG: S1 RNA-binding domain-containing protein, partial [Planctomycetaceae bacterium]|nr:S1 RNA-binding domain-containing protein [Planctomycetaceae bacterium]
KAVVIHTGDSWRYWIQIQNTNHPAIFIPGQIERHGANTGEPTPSIFQENQEISVIIQGLPEQSTRSVRNEPNSKETKFLKQFGIEVETGERPRLILTGRLTLEAYRRIRASDLSEEFKYAIGELHKKSNTFEAIYLRKDLNTLFPKGKKTAGTVFNINPDRVLIRLKEGILGQIDKNEITWFDDSPFIGDFVERDSSIRAVVLGTDFARQTVQLSLKRMTRDPWESTIPQKYQERKWVEGKVDGWNEDKNKVVWIELEPGLKGIVHQNDIAIPVPAKLGEVFSKDQTVRVKVKRVDRTRRSISLALFDLWGHIKKKYSPGMKCIGTVRGLNRHMAYVELAPGIEGTLHISKLSALAGGKRLGDPSEVVKKDHKLEVEVVQLNHEKESIELDVIRNTTTGKKRVSVAQSELPKRYGVGTSHVGRVSSIVGFGAFVILESGVEGLIHISNLSDDYVDDVADHVSVGEQVKVRVVKFEIKNNKAAIGLSRIY